MFVLTVHTWTGYPPGNYCNISPPKGTFEDDVPFPMVRYVGSCRIFPLICLFRHEKIRLQRLSRPKRTSSSNCPLDLKTSEKTTHPGPRTLEDSWAAIVHPGKFTWNPKNGGLAQMIFLFNWVIYNPWKMMVWRPLSYWEANFSGAMLNFQGVLPCFF